MSTAAIAIALVLAHAAAAGDPAGCLAGRKQALLDGHFTGPIVCSEANATFRLIGTTKGYGYTIYDYRYSYFPYQGAPVMHGGQKIVIFHDKVYIGQYALSPPPFIDAEVRGSFLSLKVDSSASMVGVDRDSTAAEVDFSHGPPASVFINGETEDFYR